MKTVRLPIKRNFLFGKRITLICFLFFVLSYVWSRDQVVNDVFVDLSSDSINLDKPIKLNRWIFFPGELISYSEINKRRTIDNEYINIPEHWDKGDKRFKDSPYATYYLKIKKPRRQFPLVLYIEDAFTLCQIYLNDSLIVSTGKLGQDKSTSIPGRFPLYKNIFTQTEDLNLVIQVVNYWHKNGGLGNVYIGTLESIYDAKEKRNIGNIFLLGAFLIMAIFHIGLYFTRKENKAVLFFGLFTFFLSVRMWIMGELHVFWNQNINWVAALKIEYLTFFISAPLFFYYVRFLFPKGFTVKGSILFVYASALYAVLLLLFPTKFSTIILPGYQIIVAFVGIYITYISILELIKKTKGAGVFFIGWIVFFIATINDIMYFNELSSIRNLIFPGLYIFIFCQALILSLKFSEAFDHVERLANQLNYTNKNLSDLVKEKTKELKKQNKEIEIRHEQLKVLIDTLPDLIYIKDKEARFITANTKTIKIMKAKSLENIIGKTDFDFYTEEEAKKYYEDDLFILKQGKPLYKKQEDGYNEKGEQIILETSKIPLIDKKGEIYGIVGIGRDISIQKEYEGQLLDQTKKLQEINTLMEERQEEIIQQQEILKMQRDNLNDQKQLIEQKNQDITDSLNYASKIQKAVLPAKLAMDISFADHFVLYKPKDIVSGDFYWTRRIRNRILVTAADCTGHGVPGAFMSLLGITFLNEIVNSLVSKHDDEILPNLVLEELRNKIKRALKQTGSINEAQDGIDMALCIIDYAENKLYFSGANNPLYIVNRKTRKLKLDKELIEQKKILISEYDEVKLIEVKANRMPIGSYINEQEFTTHIFDLENIDQVYMFSDGYTDQIGGAKRNKFRQKRFKELLMKIYSKTMQEQYNILDKTFMDWKTKEVDQIDDILVLGLKLAESGDKEAFGFFEP